MNSLDTKKRFMKKAAFILFATFFLFYYYGGVNVEQLNVLFPYYIGQGWNSLSLTSPITVASVVSVPLTFLIGTLLLKFDVKKVLGLSGILAGVGIIILGFAGNSVAIYWVGMLLARIAVLSLSMGSIMLCTNWFVKKRGTVLGIITIGCPLCTATLVTILTYSSQSSLGFSGSYIIWGGLLIVLSICILAFIRSRPEECGLLPDGAAQETAQEVPEEHVTLSVKEVLGNKRSWLLIIAFGFLNWTIGCVAGFYTTHMMLSGSSQEFYLLWLSIGSVLGIPLSYLLGILDDKIGTPKAALILCGLFLLCLCGMIFMTANSLAMIILVAIGMAGMTGGTANLHPSMTVYVFGHKQFQAANRWIAALQSLVAAFASSFMGVMLDSTGTLKWAYVICVVMVLIAAVCIVLVGKTPDYDKRS